MVGSTATSQPNYAFDPDTVTEPGSILQETIDSLGMTPREFAERTAFPLEHIQQLITGQARMTPEAAGRLEQVTRVPARFWNNLETQYQERKARLQSTHAADVDGTEGVK